MARIERTKNASRNIVFGILLKLYQILVPFAMRTVMIYLMGVQYLGLNSLFTSILQVLNLAELGVGSAMVFSMYKPIADDDAQSICKLLRLYRVYYRVIGLLIAVVGCALTPVIPKLIHGTVPANLNIYVLYLLNLAATVCSYWLFAYKNSLLQAHQRTDVVSKVGLLTSTIQYGLQMFVLWAFHNYYLYVLVALFTQALTNILTALAATRFYPQYKPKGKISKAQIQKINQRIRDLFTSKVGAIVYNSADTIVVSACLGLTVLAVYQNYFYILNAVSSLIAVAFSACTAAIGNSIVTESRKKNFRDFDTFTFIIFWIGGVCSVCLLCLYQPFMELWVGRDLMLPFSAVICFVIYFYVYQYNSLLNMYKDAVGLWHEDRWRPLISALVNLALNLILVHFIGIFGVLLSTVLAILFVGMPWLIHNLFTIIFDRKYMIPFLWKIFQYSLMVIISCVICFFLCQWVHLESFAGLIIRGLICVMASCLIYYLAFRKSVQFQRTLHLTNSMTKGKMYRILIKLGMK